MLGANLALVAATLWYILVSMDGRLLAWLALCLLLPLLFAVGCLLLFSVPVCWLARLLAKSSQASVEGVYTLFDWFMDTEDRLYK